MLFEETVPAGTKSTHHLHHDSDEVVWVLEGEFTFKIGDEVFFGGPGTCAFLPRKVPHAWKSNGPGDGARAVSLHAGQRRAVCRGEVRARAAAQR